MGSVVISGATSGAVTLTVPDDAGTRTLTLPATTGTILTNDISQAGDTSAGNAAAVGYTSAEGLILTGQGSTSDVTIKNDADATVISIPTGTQTVQIDGTGTDDFLVIKTTEASANSAPDVVLYRLSSSPADNDFLGKFVFRGRNDNTQDVTYSQIVSQAIDVSDGSEDGRLYLQTKVAGSDINHITLDADGIKLENNVVVVGTARRITGDFSNATIANRVAFQTSTADASTIVNVITNGTGSFSGVRVFNNSSTTNATYGTFAASGSTAVEVKSERSGSGTYLPLDFYTSGSIRMRILADGKVGIGTSAPAAGLHIESTGTEALRTLRLAYDGTYYANIAQAGAAGLYYRTYGGLPHIWEQGGAEKMRIHSDGNVLIQSATSYSDGSIGNACFQLDGRSGARTGMCVRAKTTDGSAFVTSGVSMIGFVNGNGLVGNISTNGSATSFNTSSDYRLKENVSYSFNATTRLKQLKPARFNFKADADTTVDGFLAHEVSSIVPEAVTGAKDAVDGDGDPIHQSIDQSKLVPLLVKTIQELEARITALEAG